MLDAAQSEAAGLRSEVARLQTQMDAARDSALAQHHDTLRSEIDHLKKVRVRALVCAWQCG